MNELPLVPVHADDTRIPSKLESYRKLSSEVSIASLQPNQDASLRTRPDGTMLNGHHRIKVLRERGVDVDALPREVFEKEPLPDFP